MFSYLPPDIEMRLFMLEQNMQQLTCYHYRTCFRMADTEIVEEETTKLNGEDEVAEEAETATEQTKKKRKRKKKKKTGVVVFRDWWFSQFPGPFIRCAFPFVVNLWSSSSRCWFPRHGRRSFFVKSFRNV